MRRYTLLLLLAGWLAMQCGNPDAGAGMSHAATHFSAFYGSPVVDGRPQDSVWMKADWLPLDQLWMGDKPSANDFSGRYKVAWDENNLYLLVEIKDDTLVDLRQDGLDRYWDDDCLEVFLDEDGSGGEHQYNYNAFAYHIALDGQVADIGPDSAYHYYTDHCFVRRSTRGTTSVWELALKVFSDSYEDGGDNIPMLLSAGKHMGFALAYCDNDHSDAREHFMGNVAVEGEDKNRAWIDAGIFGHLSLEQ